MRVLIIEDDSVFARTLARALSRRGHASTAAATGDAALAALDAKSFDAAVLDLKLGERSGLALIEPLLAGAPGLRIVMLTGYASIATATQAIRLGARDYLPKPATASQILAALEEPDDEAMPPAAEPLSLRRLEWEHIQRVLADNDYSIAATARALHMHRRTLQRKLAKRPVSE